MTNIVTATNQIARPLSCGENMSAATAEGLVNALDPIEPVKNRRMRRVQISCEAAAAALKAAKPKKVLMNTY